MDSWGDRMNYKISAGTIGRTLCLVLALVNQILTSTGHAVIPIDDETIVQLVSLCFTVGTSLVAWWKNNSFSISARKADAIMKADKERIA